MALEIAEITGPGMGIQGRRQGVAKALARAARLRRERADVRLSAAGLWREIRATRSGELGEDRQVRVQPDPLKTSDAQR